jgi:hypothetical protein
MPTKKNPAAVQLGRLGGFASAKAKTKAERIALARKAVTVRWRKSRKERS